MESQKPGYTPPTVPVLALDLRAVALDITDLASELPAELPPEQRLAVDRMIGDLRAQLTRCERAAGLMRRADTTLAPTAEG